MVGVISGSLGLLPSATLPGPGVSGGSIRGGVFEPTHGSAPDISGKGIANPIGAILSVAMIFEYAMARADIAREIEQAIEHVLKTGPLTPDIGGSAGSTALTEAIIASLQVADLVRMIRTHGHG
jgi:3-isopropylmalate dehydrogenase